MESGDELLPSIASFDEPASRSGRRIQPPKPLTYPDNQVRCSVMYDEEVMIVYVHPMFRSKFKREQSTDQDLRNRPVIFTAQPSTLHISVL